MSVRKLDRLVARALVDPSFGHALANGSRPKILAVSGFQANDREQLLELGAESWQDFAAAAYRVLAHDAAPAAEPQFPSTAEGLTTRSFEGRLAA